MRRRVVSVCLAAILLLTAILPMGVSAAYENTYKNTGDQRADIIGVALTQVGYIEEAGGYTKYGQWFGHPYADWCGIFISWCADQAGIPSGVLRRNGLASPSGFGFSTYYSSSQYTPKPGDLFFTKNSRGNFTHAGIVYYVDGDHFQTLEGNTWYNGSPHGVMSRRRVLSEHYYVQVNYNGSGGSITPPTSPSCDHSWKDDSVVKAPTCTESGSKSQICSKCDSKRTVTVSAKGHSFGDWEEKDEKLHQRSCENCNKIETKDHDKMKWQSDSAGHWKECQTCKGQVQIEGHTYAGGCGTACTVCDYKSQDGHNYGVWQTDETGHWQVCTACQKETEHKAHNYPAQCAESCADCGYTRATEHTYEQRSDARGHWLACPVCGKEESIEKHTPGAEATEENAQSCILCGFEIAPKLEHTHSYTYTADRLTHRGQCACGETVEENHIWSIEQSGCSVCGAVAETAEEGFNWDIVWLSAGGAALAGTVLWVVLTVCKKKRKA